MGDLDFVAKILMRIAPEAFVRLCLGRNVRVISCRSADKEVERFKGVMDKLYELKLADEVDSLWQHVEVSAQWRANLPFRMLEYWVLSRGVVEGPLCSLLICLKPGDRQGAPKSAYQQTAAGTAIAHRYTLVCAWEWTVAELLAGDPALIPFVPFAGDASLEGVDEAIEAATHADITLRADLLAALAVFASNVFKDVDWSARMPRELIMENTIYKQGQAAGELKGELKMVRLMLDKKLGAAATPFFPRLESCTSVQLEALGAELVADQSRGELIAALERVLAGD